MSAKDVVRAREQSKRRPAKLPFEQTIHKRKPAKVVEPVVESIIEPEVTDTEPEATDDPETTGEDVL